MESIQLVFKMLKARKSSKNKNKSDGCNVSDECITKMNFTIELIDAVFVLLALSLLIWGVYIDFNLFLSNIFDGITEKYIAMIVGSIVVFMGFFYPSLCYPCVCKSWAKCNCDQCIIGLQE